MSANETPGHAAALAEDLPEKLHDFHLTGRPLEIADPLDGAPLQPLAIDALPEPEHSFPLCFEPTGPAGFRPLGALLEEVFSAEGFELLRGRAAAPARLVAEWLGREGKLEGPLLEAIQACLEDLPGQPELRDEDAADVAAVGRRLLTRLPRSTRVLAFSASAATFVHVRTQLDSRQAAQKALADRARRLLQRLEGMLLHGGEPEGAVQLASELGAQTDRLLDVGVLAHSLRRTSGHQPLDPQRRARIETAAQTLRGFVERASTPTMISLLHSPSAPAAIHVPGVAWIEVEEPLAAATERARTDFAWFSGLLRAFRLGALEAEHAYVPAKHDCALERLDWQAGGRDEVAAAPLCIAVDTAANLADEGLTTLGRAMRSGLPLQALALDDSGAAPTASASDLAYGATAHRDAFVLQAPLVAAEAVTNGSSGMSRALRPSLAVVAVPSGENRPTARMAQARAAWRARITPVFVYDPDAGEGWAERFSLSGNPDPSAVFAGVRPADAAALDPACREHFAVLPEGAGDAGQVPLEEYLDPSAPPPPASTPCILVRGPASRPAHAAITRELANFCRRVRSAWRIYQDLAQAGGAAAQTAVADARLQLGDERERIAAEARRQGAKEAVYRIVASLAGSTELPKILAQSAQPSPTPAAPPAADAGETPPQQAPKPAAEPVGPYIDSSLCTSCNECINRNPKMFRYNDNKQAYIADPKAGTYEQLLKAAAACPAQCIHAGPPPG